MALKLLQMNYMDKAKKLSDYFYLKRIMKGPENSRALRAFANSRRVFLENQMDLEELKQIDIKKEELVRLNTKDPSVIKHLMKEIYARHIHHTVAIEGNTMTLAQTRTVLETRKPIRGKSRLDYNEILSLESALGYLNETLSNKNDVTISDILQMHRRVMGHVPKIAGTFRKVQVYVGEHIPPPASEVKALMDDFVAELHSPHIRNMHPIHIAAFAHEKLVFIHPFVDGNGRTSRLLMNLFFIRYGFPLITIKNEEINEYFNCLEIAQQEGNIRPFYRFIAHSAEQTIDGLLRSHEEFNKTKTIKI